MDKELYTQPLKKSQIPLKIPLSHPSPHTPPIVTPYSYPLLFCDFLGATVPHAPPQKIFPEKFFQKILTPPSVKTPSQATLLANGRLPTTPSQPERPVADGRATIPQCRPSSSFIRRFKKEYSANNMSAEYTYVNLFDVYIT